MLFIKTLLSFNILRLLIALGCVAPLELAAADGIYLTPKGITGYSSTMKFNSGVEVGFYSSETYNYNAGGIGELPVFSMYAGWLFNSSGYRIYAGPQLSFILGGLSTALFNEDYKGVSSPGIQFDAWLSCILGLNLRISHYFSHATKTNERAIHFFIVIPIPISD